MKYIILSFLLINSSLLFSQAKSEIIAFKDLNSLTKSTNYKYTIDADNEINLIFTNAFIFYKKHLSSHDYGKCSFTPSCSEYALEAIKKKGLIFGIIMFFDRFSRCNGLNNKDYKQDFEKQLLYDPVE